LQDLKYNNCCLLVSCSNMSSSNSNAPPATPESQRRTARTADRLQQLQMTDPDQRRTRISGRNNPAPPTVPQPDFFAQLAAQIPQVHVPDSVYAPRQFPVPVIGVPLQPAGPTATSNDPFTATIPNPQQPALHIPEVQLPAGWNAPLQNPIPVVPPAPQLQTKRGRRRQEIPNAVDPAVQQQLLQQAAIRQAEADMQLEQLQEQVAEAHAAEQQAGLAAEPWLLDPP
jgi:hypothetical protein